MRPVSAFDHISQQLQYQNTPISRIVFCAQILTTQQTISDLFKTLTHSDTDPIFTGFLAHTAGYALVLLEAAHDTLIEFLRQLQVYVKRGPLPAHHALLTAQQHQQPPILSQPKVFTFIEDVAQVLPNFTILNLKLSQNEADLKPAEAACFVAVSAHKIAVAINLATIDALNVEEKANELGDDLPCPGYIERFCGVADLGEKQFAGPGKVQVGQLEPEVAAEVEKLREDMKNVGGEGQTDIEDIYCLDQFMIELVNNDGVQLFEDESANLNEFWLYENLKHILGI